MSLISAAELAHALAEPVPEIPVVACDVRFYLNDHDQGAREYADGHVPGARFVDLHGELADVTRGGAGRHPLPTPQAFAALLGRLGISPVTHVVAYDAAAGATAARLWWMLQAIGHARASVLDGGWSAWVAGGYAISATAPDIEPVDYPIPTADTWPGAVSADEVAAAIADDSAVVIDSRAPERYRGDAEPIDPRAGHVPGAVNVFHAANVGSDGTLLSVDELAERFADVGTAPIVYCGSGVTACHNLLAMERAGVRGARLYPGSWSEWSADPARPVATGDEP
jgi:thiosulfate/3-mercaptopyruvate sulfurtransferase